VELARRDDQEKDQKNFCGSHGKRKSHQCEQAGNSANGKMVKKKRKDVADM
jgi:hypothetical protein